MLPHMRALGIRKALLMSSGESAGTLPPQDYEAICFGNAQRLYGLH